jgi:hypothetical protein
VCRLLINPGTSRHRARCRGLSILEVTLAAALFSMLVATSLQMMRVVSNRHLASERRDYALQAAQAISEQVVNIPWDELTTDAVEQITVPPAIAERLPAVKLSIELADEPEPTAKRARVEVSWQNPARQMSSLSLTSWSFPDLPQ